MLSKHSITIAALLLAWGSTQTSIAADAPSAERGRTLFAAVGCYQCHGYQGQGGDVGPRIAPISNEFGLFRGFIRTSNKAMPAYSKTILPDPGLRDIYAFLQAVTPPPALAKIPLLNTMP